MTKPLAVLLLACCAAFAAATRMQEPQPQRGQDPTPVTRATFAAWDVFVDSGDRALGAWQFEWHVRAGRASIVGVEGGDGTFAPAPYYDPAALAGGRIVIAAYSTEKELPRGRTRVARVHLRLDGGDAAQFGVELQACAGGDGAAIAAKVSWQRTE